MQGIARQNTRYLTPNSKGHEVIINARIPNTDSRVPFTKKERKNDGLTVVLNFILSNTILNYPCPA